MEGFWFSEVVLTGIRTLLGPELGLAKESTLRHFDDKMLPVYNKGFQALTQGHSLKSDNHAAQAQNAPPIPYHTFCHVLLDWPRARARRHCERKSSCR